MTDIKHTPAPWHYSPEVSKQSNHLVYGSKEANGNMLIANCGNHKTSEAEIIATAHLIAAAPDMYEALKESLFGLRLRQKREPDNIRLSNDIKLIEKAIAKAEGKS